MKKSNALCIIFLVFIFFAGCKNDEQQVINNNEPEEQVIKLIEPPDNYQSSSYTPLLKWESYQGALNYTLKLSMDANFLSGSLIDTNLTASELLVSQGLLNTNINYYWKVNADLGNNNFSGWSETRRFKVILSPPPPPVLLQPLNNSINQPFLPLFDWEDSPTAQVYKLQLSLNSVFTQVILDTGNIPVSQLQAPYFYINTSTNYFWRVNATNSNGASTGEWSQVFTFRTIDGNMPSSISGRIIFTDNNFIPPPQRYFVAAYKTAKWPPNSFDPDYNDTLDIQFINGQYISDYRLERIQNGSYHITVYCLGNTINNELQHKSVYGCDTARVIYSDCAINNPGTVTITNGTGIININMLSWADTSKSIF